jgi:PAS domain S-box-containing protein
MCRTHKKQSVFGMEDNQFPSVKNFLDMIVEAIPIPVFFKDTHGKYLGCNHAFENFLGIKKEKLINKTVFDLFPQKTADFFCAQDDKLFHRGGTQEYECQFESTDQEIRDALFKKGLFTDHTGNVLGLIGVVLDVTERNKAQKALEESEKKYRLLAENTADIIWSVDDELNFTYISPSIERIMGYTQKEALEIGWASRITPASYTMLMEKYEAAKSGQLTSTLTIELERIHKKGHIVPIEVSLTPIFDSDRCLVAVHGVSRDITFRKKQEHIRISHQRRLRSLAAKLAMAQEMEQRRIAEGLHDDVAQILSACSIQLSLVHGTQDLQKVFGIVQECEKLIALANERIRQLCFELTSSTLYKLGLRAAIQELCEGIKARYGVCFTVHGNGCSSALDDESSTVLFKAVRELIFNVIKHAKVQKGTVIIKNTDRLLQLTVEDHGVGFAKEIENIELTSGNGLGIFGIQERLKDLGGTLHIQSIPNKLTQVTLSVPLNTK